MEKERRTSMILFLTLTLLSCQQIESKDRQQTKNSFQERKSRVVVMGIDDTGSYGLWEKAKSIAYSVVSQLRPGDIFYLRRITDASYTDDSGVFRLELPKIPISKIDNPFDRKTKRHKQLYFHKQPQLQGIEYPLRSSSLQGYPCPC